MPHLALSDQQLASVLKASECIPHRWRNRFLEAIADRLLGFEPTDELVSEAIHFAASRFYTNLSAVTCIQCSEGL